MSSTNGVDKASANIIDRASTLLPRRSDAGGEKRPDQELEARAVADCKVQPNSAAPAFPPPTPLNEPVAGEVVEPDPGTPPATATDDPAAHTLVAPTLNAPVVLAISTAPHGRDSTTLVLVRPTT